MKFAGTALLLFATLSFAGCAVASGAPDESVESSSAALIDQPARTADDHLSSAVARTRPVAPTGAQISVNGKPTKLDFGDDDGLAQGADALQHHTHPSKAAVDLELGADQNTIPQQWWH